MVWGAFSAAGTGEMLWINALEYRRILQKGLLFSKEEQLDVIFHQDNAPAHTARTSKMWFEKKSIRLMFWPSRTPDLNPIENITYIEFHIKHKLTGKQKTNYSSIV